MWKPSRALRLHLTPVRSAKPPPTHFTSTSPHAFAPLRHDPSSERASTIDLQPGGQIGETPGKRVERLRAAARAAKLAELPWQERWIDRGRFVTDKVHRGFIVFLVGASVLIGGYTVFALGDMFMYNRRKRSEWQKEKQKRNEEALYTAIQAVHQGTANMKQKVLVRRYEMVKNAEDERLQQRGTLGRSFDWLLPGVRGRQSEAKLVMKLDADIVDLLHTGEIERFLNEEQAIPSAVATQKPLDKFVGGPLDQEAQKATRAWKSWLWSR